METKANYALVGLFVILIGAGLIMAAFWIGGGVAHKTYKRYLVYMDEAVSGLNEQAAVKFNGVSVGNVDGIHLNPHNLKQVILTLKIESDVPITETTVATLKAQGITGLTYIGLKALTPHAPLLKAKPGEAYPVIPSEPSFLVQIDKTIRDVAKNIRQVAQNINQAFDIKNREAMTRSLANIERFSKNLADNTQRLDQMIKDTNKLLSNAAKASDDLPQIINQVKSTAEQVKLASQEAKAVLHSIRQRTVPNANELLSRLNSVANNLEDISNTIKSNPSIIIRGQLAGPPGPGES